MANNIQESLSSDEMKAVDALFKVMVKTKQDAADLAAKFMKTKSPSDVRFAKEIIARGTNMAEQHNEELDEAIVKAVDRTGKVTRKLDRKTRMRRATQTTGLSKAKRKKIARKAARTKKRDQGGQRRAQKLRKRTLRKRKSMGL